MQRRDGAPGQDGFSASIPGARRMRQQAQQGIPQPPPAVHRALELAECGDGTYAVVRCLEPHADDINIAFETGNCAVSVIAPKAFAGMTFLRRVTLPDGLVSIGEMAFSGCTALAELVIPGSVQRVGTLGFAKCSALRRVRLEPGVQALGPSCFSKCSQLARVDIPASVRSIGGGAFFGCPRSMVFSGAAGTYGEAYAKLNGIAFDAESWREDPVLNLCENEDGTLTVLGARQEAPEIIEIPCELCGRRIAAIAERAFANRLTLRRVSVGSGVQVIGDSAFFGCRMLSQVVLERGLQAIGDSAFAGCESLTEMTLPWGTLSVGRMAFFSCKRLSFVKMPTVTKLAEFVFDDCSPELRVFGGIYAGRPGAR